MAQLPAYLKMNDATSDGFLFVKSEQSHCFGE
jgi:hypothetical protein